MLYVRHRTGAAAAAGRGREDATCAGGLREAPRGGGGGQQTLLRGHPSRAVLRVADAARAPALPPRARGRPLPPAGAPGRPARGDAGEWVTTCDDDKQSGCVTMCNHSGTRHNTQPNKNVTHLMRNNNINKCRYSCSQMYLDVKQVSRSVSLKLP